MSDRGFILEPTYRVEAGKAVVHLFGRLESGETFLVRDDRQTPHFYIRTADADRARQLGATKLTPTSRVSLAGEPVSRVRLRLPSDTPALRDRLIAGGVQCFEADVRFAMRFLIDLDIRGSLEIEGRFKQGARIGRVYQNPTLAASDWAPELRVLSIDIETDPRARRLLSIALDGCGVSEVMLFTPRGWQTPAGAVPFSSERDLLRAFCQRLRELDPDVLTGWNVVDFDLRVLVDMARRFGLVLDIGRGSGSVHLRESRMPWSTHEAIVPGRVVADGIHLLRGAFIRMDDYSLDTVSREVLGEGKTDIASPAAGGDKGKQILDAFRHDRERFVQYNLTDARLVSEILGQLRLLDLAVERSRLTGLPIDRISGSIAAFDFLYLSELYKRGIVAPSVGGGDGDEAASPNLGGHVLEPVTGLHHNVLVFDFKSLYPSLIRTFQIDPLGYLPEPGPGDDPIVAPNGAAFRREPGILTDILDRLFPRREAAKARGDGVASHAIKILMNSFYGVLGTRACRFYRPEVASAITSFGQEVLLWVKKRIEQRGFQVLYGDTDSLFVLSDQRTSAAARAVGGNLTRELDGRVARWIEERWRLESRLELELETLYRQLMLPPMRHGRGGARKRYVGLVGEGEEAEVVFTGMEVVRRDWTELAKRVQRELYERLFAGERIEDYLALVVANLRQGRLDDLVVYHKGLRKSLDEYTSTTPPHVAAARKLSRKPGRIISYVMTTDGAEPIEERRHEIDHEHYVQKQIRPVAEPVLAILELEFDKVIGDDTQMELF
ncbi:MAG: DNA polymerase II [bacterium]|nr:DNA polymerase II [bacterium]